MSIEIKALVSAIVAGFAVLGVTFGVASVVRSQIKSHPAAQTSSAPTSGTGTKIAVNDPALISKGQGFYAKSCASCHGDHAEGAYGPLLVGMPDSDAEIAGVIKQGVPGKMPGFAKKYSDADVQTIVTYLRSIKS